MLTNKRLKNFLNKNVSSKSLKGKEDSNKTKIKNQNEVTILKSNLITRNKETIEKIKKYYNKEKFKKIFPSKISTNNREITKKRNDENTFNCNKDNMKIKNNKIKNIVISTKSSNRIVNKKQRNLNISSNQINEDINKIKRRKMDLIKILNFSTHIGIK